jgi:S1-C subfamily serine protease
MLLSILLIFGTTAAFTGTRNNSSLTNNYETLIPYGTYSSLPDLFDAAKASVVEINVLVPITNQHLLIHGTPKTSYMVQEGSGFVYDSDAHIVTNDHVVRRATTIDVRFLDGNVYSAHVSGEDPYSDLAVLQLEPLAVGNVMAKEIKPLVLGNSSSVRVGESVVAIGNPLGLTGSMTQGIISQTDRVKPDALLGKFYVAGLIQTDAAISHGNSGGPLLTLDGKVIGVTERGQPSDEGAGLVPGINFAIPSNTVERVIPELISHGTYKHSWLGVHVIDINPDIARALSLKTPEGVLVVGITTGSPAYMAGLSSGKNSTVVDGQSLNTDADIIIGMDGKRVRVISDLINYVDSKVPGDNVVLKLFRNDKPIHDITVKLAARPSLEIFQNSLSTVDHILR